MDEKPTLYADVVDYISRVRAEEKANKENLYIKNEQLFEELREYSKKNNCAIITASQPQKTVAMDFASLYPHSMNISEELIAKMEDDRIQKENHEKIDLL